MAVCCVFHLVWWHKSGLVRPGIKRKMSTFPDLPDFFFHPRINCPWCPFSGGSISHLSAAWIGKPVSRDGKGWFRWLRLKRRKKSVPSFSGISFSSIDMIVENWMRKMKMRSELRKRGKNGFPLPFFPFLFQFSESGSNAQDFAFRFRFSSSPIFLLPSIFLISWSGNGRNYQIFLFFSLVKLLLFIVEKVDFCL